MKRSITIDGHRTSVSLEDAFWEALGEIAAARGISIAAQIGEIDHDRGPMNLSAAIRTYVLAWYRDRAATAVG